MHAKRVPLPEAEIITMVQEATEDADCEDIVQLLLKDKSQAEDFVLAVKLQLQKTDKSTRLAALKVLERAMERCSECLATHVGSKDFMSQLLSMVRAKKLLMPQSIKDKILELIQVWAAKYEQPTTFQTTFQLLINEGIKFPGEVAATPTQKFRPLEIESAAPVQGDPLRFRFGFAHMTAANERNVPPPESTRSNDDEDIAPPLTTTKSRLESILEARQGNSVSAEDRAWWRPLEGVIKLESDVQLITEHMEGLRELIDMAGYDRKSVPFQTLKKQGEICKTIYSKVLEAAERFSHDERLLVITNHLLEALGELLDDYDAIYGLKRGTGRQVVKTKEQVPSGACRPTFTGLFSEDLRAHLKSQLPEPAPPGDDESDVEPPVGDRFTQLQVDDDEGGTETVLQSGTGFSFVPNA